MTAAGMIGVETVVQALLPANPAGVEPQLLRQGHRIAAGTTIRQLLRNSGLGKVADGIESGRLGLSVFGKRAWLDDILVDGSRVEVVAPIRADAKAARVARAEADRSRRRNRISSVR